jgi:MtfA peptidase
VELKWLVIALILIGLSAFFFLPAYRLRLALARPFPSAFAKILRKNIPSYARMSVPIQLRLKRLIKQFLHEKKFVGCDGFEITDEVRVTIAAKACLLLLNRKTLVYPKLEFVLVYPTTFVVPRVETGLGGVVTHQNQTLSGESWSDGRVILAWEHIEQDRENAGSGHDVVVHEFAHQLDSESGNTNGAPLLPSAAHYARWAQVFEREFALLTSAEQAGLETVLDHYGATNPAEFFAVATEAFFEKSHALAQHHAELFEQLRSYYRVDPRLWQ